VSCAVTPPVVIARNCSAPTQPDVGYGLFSSLCMMPVRSFRHSRDHCWRVRGVLIQHYFCSESGDPSSARLLHDDTTEHELVGENTD
jgi:hypothetical protein